MVQIAANAPTGCGRRDLSMSREVVPISNKRGVELANLERPFCAK